MTGEVVDDTSRRPTEEYDPFARGRFTVGVRTVEEFDSARARLFPCEVWYPAAAEHAGQDIAPATVDVFTAQLVGERSQSAVRDAAAMPGTYPLIIFSHSAGAGRRSATFLCTHLSSHGYVVAALDHSEVVAPELGRREGETDEQKAERWEALIASRVPDALLLLDRVVGGRALPAGIQIDETRIGIVGHSFGGWTALAAPDIDQRIRAVVALAPGGASRTRPGVLPARLAFSWGRDVPTLFLVAENDASLPLDGMYEVFERTPATKRMFILRRADHMHFRDNVEEVHEAVRAMPWPAELAWLPKEMLPISELCSGEQAHLFVRGLTLCHMDATLGRTAQAEKFLAGDVEAELASRGVEAVEYKPTAEVE